MRGTPLPLASPGAPPVAGAICRPAAVSRRAATSPSRSCSDAIRRRWLAVAPTITYSACIRAPEVTLSKLRSSLMDRHDGACSVADDLTRSFPGTTRPGWTFCVGGGRPMVRALNGRDAHEIVRGETLAVVGESGLR